MLPLTKISQAYRYKYKQAEKYASIFAGIKIISNTLVDEEPALIISNVGFKDPFHTEKGDTCNKAKLTFHRE